MDQKEPPCCNDPIYTAIMLHAAEVEKQGQSITVALSCVAGAIAGLTIVLAIALACL